MTLPSISSSDQWHTLKIDGVALPGMAKVEIKIKDNRDKQKSPGANKTRTRNKGSDGASLKITIELADDEDIKKFESVAVPILRKRSNKAAPDPHRITHPLASMWGISVVTIGEISVPAPSSKDGMKVSFDLDEWSPEPKAAKQPKEAPKSEEEPFVFGVDPPPTTAELANGNAFGALLEKFRR